MLYFDTDEMRLGSALHPILPPSTLALYICSLHLNVLFLLLLVMVVIYIVVVIVVILSLSLFCCLLRILVSSRLFPFLVVYLYISVCRMSLSVHALTTFSSSLASPPATPPLPLIVSRSLFALWGRKSPRDFSPTPSSSGDLRAFCVGSFEEPINPIASIHLDPRIIEDI